MEILLFWIGGAILVGMLASKRGRSGGAWFVLSLIFSPLLAGLFVLVLGMADSKDVRKCPFCMEPVAAQAVRCKHCQADISASVLRV